MGTVVAPYGTVVYGTGYAYTPWVGTVWYPPPYTYGIAAIPVYNPALGFTYGFAIGLATAAWVTPYWRGVSPLPLLRQRERERLRPVPQHRLFGTKTAYASANGTVGVSGSGSYYNKAHGNVGQLRDQQELQPIHRRGKAERRGLGNDGGRRLRNRCGRPQLQHLHRPEDGGIELLGHRRRRQHASFTRVRRPQARKAMGTPARRRSTTPTPARAGPTARARPTITTPMQAATSTRAARAAAGSRARRAAGASRAAIPRRWTGNPRHAAAAPSARAGSPAVEAFPAVVAAGSAAEAAAVAASATVRPKQGLLVASAQMRKRRSSAIHSSRTPTAPL